MDFGDVLDYFKTALYRLKMADAEFKPNTGAITVHISTSKFPFTARATIQSN